jgi:hypothetical protein
LQRSAGAVDFIHLRALQKPPLSFPGSENNGILRGSGIQAKARVFRAIPPASPNPSG